MKEESNCYCESEKSFENCCGKFIKGAENPTTSEELMRSRYSAYVLANAAYIIHTTHPKTRYLYSKKAILKWAKENNWQNLEVIKTETNTVVFKACFKDETGKEHIHFEKSIFEKLGGKWYYVSGDFEE